MNIKQAKQEMHLSPSTALPPSLLMLSIGQIRAQMPQPLHPALTESLHSRGFAASLDMARIMRRMMPRDGISSFSSLISLMIWPILFWTLLSVASVSISPTASFLKGTYAIGIFTDAP